MQITIVKQIRLKQHRGVLILLEADAGIIRGSIDAIGLQLIEINIITTFINCRFKQGWSGMTHKTLAINKRKKIYFIYALSGS